MVFLNSRVVQYKSDTKEARNARMSWTILFAEFRFPCSAREFISSTVFEVEKINKILKYRLNFVSVFFKLNIFRLKISI